MTKESPLETMNGPSIAPLTLCGLLWIQILAQTQAQHAGPIYEPTTIHEGTLRGALDHHDGESNWIALVTTERGTFLLVGVIGKYDALKKFTNKRVLVKGAITTAMLLPDGGTAPLRGSVAGLKYVGNLTISSLLDVSLAPTGKSGSNPWIPAVKKAWARSYAHPTVAGTMSVRFEFDAGERNGCILKGDLQIEFPLPKTLDLDPSSAMKTKFDADIKDQDGSKGRAAFLAALGTFVRHDWARRPSFEEAFPSSTFSSDPKSEGRILVEKGRYRQIRLEGERITGTTDPEGKELLLQWDTLDKKDVLARIEADGDVLTVRSAKVQSAQEFILPIEIHWKPKGAAPESASSIRFHNWRFDPKR